MSNNNGVFGWIREAVRRSVLLGFSDAVEQLGVPAESGELHPQLAAVLRSSSPMAAIGQSGGDTRGYQKPERKRLGRSLDQLRESPLKSTSANVEE